MSDRSAFIVRLLEKLGAPFMAAIEDVAAQVAAESESPLAHDAQEDAKTLAGMLGRAVELGIAVAGSMNLKEDDGDSDAVRLALAGMAGPLLAESYRRHGVIPADQDIERMAKSLKAVLTFSDRFVPAAEHVARLQNTGYERSLFDPAQVHIYTIGALVPAINVIAEFPFGQSESKLVKDVAARLGERAESLRVSLIGNTVPEAEGRFAELAILHALAEIYTECHKVETHKLLAGDEDSRPQEEPSMDPVWKRFDLKLAMLEVLLDIAVPGAPERTAPVPPPAPTEQPQDISAPPVAAESSSSKDQDHADGDSGSPMGFFKKNDATASVEAAASGPGNSAPSPLPASSLAPEEASNPMAFFKPGSKKPDDDSSD